jgi:hypothetical protein
MLDKIFMKFEAKYSGKWVATKNNKVIASGKSLNKLVKKVEKKKDSEKYRYTLVPKGLIAG